MNILRKLVLEEDCAVNTLGAGTAEGLEVPACYKFLNKIERINKTGSLVYHPPASEALSIRSSDGFPRMNGQQLAKWLSDIVVSRVKLYNMQEVSDLGGQINRKGQKNQQGVGPPVQHQLQHCIIVYLKCIAATEEVNTGCPSWCLEYL